MEKWRTHRTESPTAYRPRRASECAKTTKLFSPFLNSLISRGFERSSIINHTSSHHPPSSVVIHQQSSFVLYYLAIEQRIVIRSSYLSLSHRCSLLLICQAIVHARGRHRTLYTSYHKAWPWNLFSTDSSCWCHSTYSHSHTPVQKLLNQTEMPEGVIDVFSPSIKELRTKASRNREKPLQQPLSLKKTFKRIVSYLKPQGLKNIKEDTTKESDLSRTSIQMTSIPAELLLVIISHLDIVNQICLQITCRFFRAFIIVDRVALERQRCRKWALTCFLEDYMGEYPAKITCAFCKTVHPTKFFRNLRHEVGLWYSLRHPTIFRDMGRMNSVPVNRFCIQHWKDCFTRDYTIRTNKGTPVRISRDPTSRWIQCRIFRYICC